jgi:transcriptional regulator GlxA family with amidase domain
MTFVMLKWTNLQTGPTRIAVVLFDRFSNLCLANCIEPMRAANTLNHGLLFDWKLLTPDGAPVHSSSEMQIMPHGAVADLETCEYLFVLASYDHARHDTPQTRWMLRKAASKAGVCVGMDAGPWLLASAGLLDGRRATVHWDLLDDFAERFLNVGAERSRVVRDAKMMTCAGAMSALDLTLGLIAEHGGLSVRLDVEALFMQGDPPVGAGQGAVSDPLVLRALALMRENLERPLSLTDLAHRLSCQPRTLDRRYRARLGAPPGTVYRHLRLSNVRKLLENSALSMGEIALRCGYDSPAAMSRAVKREYGRTPSELRRA